MNCVEPIVCVNRKPLKKFRVIQGWKENGKWTENEVYCDESIEKCEYWAQKNCSDDRGKTCYYSIEV